MAKYTRTSTSGIEIPIYLNDEPLKEALAGVPATLKDRLALAQATVKNIKVRAELDLNDTTNARKIATIQEQAARKTKEQFENIAGILKEQYEDTLSKLNETNQATVVAAHTAYLKSLLQLDNAQKDYEKRFAVQDPLSSIKDKYESFFQAFNNLPKLIKEMTQYAGAISQAQEEIQSLGYALNNLRSQKKNLTAQLTGQDISTLKQNALTAEDRKKLSNDLKKDKENRRNLLKERRNISSEIKNTQKEIEDVSQKAKDLIVGHAGKLLKTIGKDYLTELPESVLKDAQKVAKRLTRKYDEELLNNAGKNSYLESNKNYYATLDKAFGVPETRKPTQLPPVAVELFGRLNELADQKAELANQLKAKKEENKNARELIKTSETTLKLYDEIEKTEKQLDSKQNNVAVRQSSEQAKYDKTNKAVKKLYPFKTPSVNLINLSDLSAQLDVAESVVREKQGRLSKAFSDYQNTVAEFLKNEKPIQDQIANLQASLKLASSKENEDTIKAQIQKARQQLANLGKNVESAKAKFENARATVIAANEEFETLSKQNPFANLGENFSREALAISGRLEELKKQKEKLLADKRNPNASALVNQIDAETYALEKRLKRLPALQKEFEKNASRSATSSELEQLQKDIEQQIKLTVKLANTLRSRVSSITKIQKDTGNQKFGSDFLSDLQKQLKQVEESIERLSKLQEQVQKSTQAPLAANAFSFTDGATSQRVSYLQSAKGYLQEQARSLIAEQKNLREQLNAPDTSALEAGRIRAEYEQVTVQLRNCTSALKELNQEWRELNSTAIDKATSKVKQFFDSILSHLPRTRAEAQRLQESFNRLSFKDFSKTTLTRLYQSITGGAISQLNNLAMAFSGFESSTKSFGTSIQQALMIIDAVPTGIGKVLAAFAAIPVVALGAENSLLGLAKPAIEAQNALFVMSLGMHSTIEDMANLSVLAQVSGVNINSINVALRRVNAQLVKTSEGSKLARETLAKFGAQMRDENGNLKQGMAQLDEIARAYQRAMALGQGAEFRYSVGGRYWDNDFVAVISDYANNVAAMKKIRKSGLSDPALAYNVRGSMYQLEAQERQWEKAFSSAFMPVTALVAPEVQQRFAQMTALIENNAGVIKNVGYKVGELVGVVSTLTTKLVEFGVVAAKVIDTLPLGDTTAANTFVGGISSGFNEEIVNRMLSVEELKKYITDQQSIAEGISNETATRILARSEEGRDVLAEIRRRVLITLGLEGKELEEEVKRYKQTLLDVSKTIKKSRTGYPYNTKVTPYSSAYNGFNGSVNYYSEKVNDAQNEVFQRLLGSAGTEVIAETNERMAEVAENAYNTAQAVSGVLETISKLEDENQKLDLKNQFGDNSFALKVAETNAELKKMLEDLPKINDELNTEDKIVKRYKKDIKELLGKYLEVDDALIENLNTLEEETELWKEAHKNLANYNEELKKNTQIYENRRKAIISEHVKGNNDTKGENLKAASSDYDSIKNARNANLAKLEYTTQAEELALKNARAKIAAEEKKYAEETEKLSKETADIWYESEHSAVEKQLRDLEILKNKQLEVAKLTQDEQLKTQRTAAITTNTYAKQAKVIEDALKKARGDIETLEEKLFKQEHSQRDNDIYDAQKERAKALKERPEQEELINRIYENRLKEIESNKSKDYRKLPKWMRKKQNKHNGFIYYGDEVNDAPAPNENRIPIFYGNDTTSKPPEKDKTPETNFYEELQKRVEQDMEKLSLSTLSAGENLNYFSKALQMVSEMLPELPEQFSEMLNQIVEQAQKENGAQTPNAPEQKDTALSDQVAEGAISVTKVAGALTTTVAALAPIFPQLGIAGAAIGKLAAIGSSLGLIGESADAYRNIAQNDQSQNQVSTNRPSGNNRVEDSLLSQFQTSVESKLDAISQKIEACEKKLGDVITNLQPLDKLVKAINDLSTKAGEIASNAQQPAQITINVPTTNNINLGGAYVFDNALKNQLTTDITNNVASAVTSAVNQAATQIQRLGYNN